MRVVNLAVSIRSFFLLGSWAVVPRRERQRPEAGAPAVRSRWRQRPFSSACGSLQESFSSQLFFPFPVFPSLFSFALRAQLPRSCPVVSRDHQLLFEHSLRWRSP